MEPAELQPVPYHDKRLWTTRQFSNQCEVSKLTEKSSPFSELPQSLQSAFVLSDLLFTTSVHVLTCLKVNFLHEFSFFKNAEDSVSSYRSRYNFANPHISRFLAA
ncbi:hypothetical protein A6X21_01105 [Planctopirus hydrillae]|uniref:Uncharacterized protein n=1 Tax=Planctopirus hydrillae TaxID=1841610 RepID=A0A1C3E4T0_9PLAN|nr:hypothetical protein A6X21_01105 [Planctopirus hydrillae]